MLADESAMRPPADGGRLRRPSDEGRARFVVGLARAIDAVPVASFGRSLGIPRGDGSVIRVADAGALFTIVLAALTVVILLRRTGSRRSRAHLAFVAFACAVFSAALMYYRVLGP